MIDAERGRFAALITGTADYYRQTISDFSIDLYWRGLYRFDIDAIESAVERHCIRPDKEGNFMPKISDLVLMLDGRSSDQSGAAWAKVDWAIRHVGTWADVVFDDALTHRIIADMGGWTWFGNKEEKEWPFIAKEFQTRYQGYRMRSESPEYLPILIGVFNSQNGVSGMQLQPPVLIGNEQKCRDVAARGNTNITIGFTRASAMLTSNQKQLQGNQ